MARRSYQQYCPAARALDVVGERWTLLIARELLLGPKRYTDLLAGLPGLAPNVLAERLKHLQETGLVARSVLPPPAASAVYELTELGRRLRAVIDELFRFGIHFMGAPSPGDRFRFGWLLASMQANAQTEAARGVFESYEFRIDGEVFHVQVDDGTVEARHGPAADPAFQLTSDLTTFMAIGAGLLTGEQAVATGAAEADGDLEAARRSLRILAAELDGPDVLCSVLRRRLQPEIPPTLQETYELRLDNKVMQVRVEDGRADVVATPPVDPAVRLATDLGTFLALSGGRLDAESALAEGRLLLQGELAARERAVALFGIGTKPREDVAA